MPPGLGKLRARLEQEHVPDLGLHGTIRCGPRWQLPLDLWELKKQTHIGAPRLPLKLANSSAANWLINFNRPLRKLKAVIGMLRDREQGPPQVRRNTLATAFKTTLGGTHETRDQQLSAVIPLLWHESNGNVVS